MTNNVLTQPNVGEERERRKHTSRDTVSCKRGRNAEASCRQQYTEFGPLVNRKGLPSCVRTQEQFSSPAPRSHRNLRRLCDCTGVHN